jgi:DNA-binding CsgD family transcriptional regulator
MPATRLSIETFSHQVLRLAQLPAALSPARLMDEGLDLLQTLVPFDAAWWGECSGGVDGRAPRNWLHGRRNLGAGMAREWNRISSTDRFARDSMTRLSAAVSISGFADPEPEVEAFGRRHDLCHALAITRALPGSGLLHFISLYRHEASPPFEPDHVVLFELFTAHLMTRWSQRVSELLGGGLPDGETQALVDGRGELVFLGARLATLLRDRFPHWDGSQLPPELALAPERLPTQWRLGRRRVTAQRCGELVLLQLAPLRQAPALPPRELLVAQRFADGQSYKAIARDTGLSPATVRTYLRDAYLRLGVANRVALGRALGDTRARRRTS